MKTLNKILLLFATVGCTFACKKEASTPVPTPEPDNGSIVRTVTFVSSVDSESKTTLNSDLKTTTWANTDNSMYHLWENDVNIPIVADENGLIEPSVSDDKSTLTLNAYMYFTRPESVTYYSVIAKTIESKTVAILPSNQTPLSSSLIDPNADILVAQTISPEVSDGQALLMKYIRPVSVGLLTLKGFEAGEMVKKVTIKADCNLAGKMQFSYGDGVSVTYLEEGATNTIVLDYGDAGVAVTNNNGSYEFPAYFTAFAGTIRELEITAETSKYKYHREVAISAGLELDPSRVLSRGFKLDQAEKGEVLPGGYVKVTSAPADWSGKYLIVYESSATAANVFNGLDASNANVSATIHAGNTIVSDATTDYDDYAVEIEHCGDGYSLKVLKGAGETNKGKYLYSSNLSGNTLGFSSDPQANTISYESQGYVLIAMTDGINSRAIRFNNDSRNMRFRYFVATTQQSVQLYKQTSAGYDKYALSTPSNISYDEDSKKIVWSEVEHASSYKVYINEEDAIVCGDRYYDASELTSDYYTVAVQAIAANDDAKYKDSAISSAQEIVIGTPQLKKPSFTTNAEVTVNSITVSWATSELDDRATNGYHLYLTENENDAEIIEGTERDVISETSTTFSNLEDNHQYRVYIYANAVTTPKEYAQSRTTYRTVRTAGYTTVEAITSAGSYAVKDAVVYAVATSGFWMNDGTAGIYCNVSQSDENLLGKIVTVEGPVAASDGQLRFQNTSVVTVTGTKEGFVQPTPIVLDKTALQNQLTTFTKGVYVQYSGKYESSNKRVNMDATSAKGTIYNPFSSTMTGIANNDYVTVRGYLTHISSTYYVNTLVTNVVKNTLTANKQDGWKDWEYDVYGEANKQIITVTTDNSPDWTFTIENGDGWSVTRVGNTIEVYPIGSNSQEATKSATITVRHGVNLVLTQTVVCNQKANVYMPVSASEITDGIYLIAYQHTDGKYYLMNTSVIQSNYIGSDGFTNLSKTTNIDDKYKFYIEKESSTSSWYLITTSANKYLYMTSSYLKNDKAITATVDGYTRWKFADIAGSEAIKATTSSGTSKWISWQMYSNNTPEYYLSNTNANAPKFYRYGDIPSYIRPSQPAEVAYNGTSATITLRSNVNWNVKSSDPTNFSVTKTNATTATVTLTVNESCSGSRSAIISFWGGDILESDPVTVQVTQNVHPKPVINANNPSAVDYNVTVVDVSYSISNRHSDTYENEHPLSAEISDAASSWISNPVYTSGKVTFTLQPYGGYDANRTGTVTLKYDDATDKTITITQNKRPRPVINASNPSAVEYDETSVDVTYTISNPLDGEHAVSAEVAADASEWISISSYDASNTKVTFSLAPNTTGKTRGGKVYLKYDDAVNKEITITQNKEGGSDPVNYEYEFNSSSWGAKLDGVAANWTSGKAGAGYTNGVQVTTNASGANATSPVAFNGITKVTVYYHTNKNAGVGKIKVEVGNDQDGYDEIDTFSVTKPAKDAGLNSKSVDFNVTPTKSGKVKLTVTCTTNSVYIEKVVVNAQ